ncbi:MAG: DEAD/DEAH box helicase [Spirochaetota bacterium]
MLPLILSRQVQQGLEEFLKTTFDPAHPDFYGFMDGLFYPEDGEKGLFQGPYISLGLPFRQEAAPEALPLQVLPPYTPYRHQLAAWQNLSGEQPRSSLIATGTGSGKTECFLYPVLDHCLQHGGARGDTGIKAIFIYPMNALATDQARRLATIIHEDGRLNGRVTAGLFIGDDGSARPASVMSRDSIITDREVMLSSPPDILLTNYKMLDLLLLRAAYAPLFAGNRPQTLKYLVVDEIHTFDGAQGSDLACLFRRLKQRLQTPDEHLIAVGTSATMGDSEEVLTRFAARIFGEEFSSESLIREDVIGPAEFLSGCSADYFLPQGSPAEFEEFPDSLAYLQAQAELWFPGQDLNLATEDGQVALGQALSRTAPFQRLLNKFGSDVFTLAQACSRLELDPAVLTSLLSLASAARRRSANGRIEPYLRIRVQLWARELRRMTASLARHPRLLFSDDQTSADGQYESAVRTLPMVHCRDCGMMGWLTYRNQTQPGQRFRDDLRSIYSHFFERSPSTYFLFPRLDEFDEAGQIVHPDQVCASCLNHFGLGDAECPACGETRPERRVAVEVINPRKTSKSTGRVYGSHDCPYCGSRNSLTIIGSQSASLNAVALSQIYSSPFNEDKKSIAFSDSVQDASHRAGFFAGRTYQFNLRMALKQIVTAMGENSRPGVLLPELYRRFVSHYKAKLGPQAYFATFTAPGIEWIPEINRILEGERDEVSDAALDFIDRRLLWDITAELGYRSHIGRTLERSGAVAVFFDTEKLDAAVAAASRRLAEEIGAFRAVPAAFVRRFILGLLRKIRIQGGILNRHTRPYVKNGGQPYHLGGINTSDHTVLPHGKFTRMPTFLSNSSYDRFDSLPHNQRGEHHWYARWSRQVFRNLTALDDYQEELYAYVLQSLVEAGLLEEVESTRGARVWGIPASEIGVTDDLVVLDCSAEGCGRTIAVSRPEADYWFEMPCDRQGCRGLFQRAREPGSNYYKRLYSVGQIQKILPAEHTGLLNRKERERVERSFITNAKPWSPNLLSATPTLEMGIDIGDLSTALLCSVPPSQANYLQRIGRTGRTDGNSFLFTVALGRPHDNYFFSDPRQMIQGHVKPPGLFLDAPRVLERQLLAFFMDSWVAEEGINLHRPLKLVLDALDPNKQLAAAALFPGQFFEYLHRKGVVLLNSFIAAFRGLIATGTVEHLHAYLNNGLEAAVHERLEQTLGERAGLEAQVRDLDRVIGEWEGLAARSAQEELQLHAARDERDALQEIHRRLNTQRLLEYLTDEGLLPNYMFPETGITLKSVILKEQTLEERKAGHKRKTVEWNYVRPASAGLSELAPENQFYAGGIRAEIDQVDLRASSRELWRLCPQCSFSQPEEIDPNRRSCPRCGFPGWGDAGQKKVMIRLRQVTAVVNERDARISDDSDNREQVYYVQHLLVDPDREAAVKAYTLEAGGSVFGFEFLSRVSLREINFGRSDENAVPIQAGGVELSAKGFTLCTRCGKVQPSDPRQAAESGPVHAPYCDVRETDGNEYLEKDVYLYRDFSSEALRLLLPYEITADDTAYYSFIAALFLGLQEFWDGRIDHIQSTHMQEPDRITGKTKNYLVLYDTVPGGTGYLKQLLNDPETLMTVFQKAQDRMQACSCRDGCYRCLLAYRNQRDMPRISKVKAIAVLANILKQRDKLTAKNALSDVSLDDYFESELEARFIQALKESADSRGRPGQLKPYFAQQYNREGFRYSFGGREYVIVQQKELTLPAGVTTRPDFLIEPIGSGAPMAVYTDGYAYHAQPEHSRLSDDVGKRTALRQAGYLVWSFSWQDVENPLLPAREQVANSLLRLDARRWKTAVSHYGLQRPWTDFSRRAAYSFAVFLDFLEQPDYRLWQSLAAGVAAALPAVQAKDAEGKPLVKLVIGDHIEGEYLPQRQQVRLRLHETPASPAGEEEFKESWNCFLLLMNLLQFLPAAAFETELTAEQRAPGEEAATQTDAGDLALEEVLELILDDTAAAFIRRAYAQGKPLPEPGYELSNAKGIVQATAEAAWIDTRECIPADPQSRRLFAAAGWTIIEEAQDESD